MEARQQTQKVFKAVMQAMANPGRIVEIGKLAEKPMLFRICETLLDQEIRFAVIGRGVEKGMIEDIYVLTGCHCVSMETADFVVVTGGSSDGSLKKISVGVLDRPEKGATVLYPVDGFNKAGDVGLKLSGPGINGESMVEIRGVEAEDMAIAAQLNGGFPLGIDLLLFDASSVLAVPRSTKIEIIKGI